MAIQSVTPEQAHELMQQGATYVDVRSEQEFDQGHPPGALNVPIAHQHGGGFAPNPDFLSVMQALFAADANLVLGCKAGGRSRRAAEMLQQAGYSTLNDMSAGWDGSRDSFGRPVPGWHLRNLPVEKGQPEAQKYEDLKAKAGR